MAITRYDPNTLTGIMYNDMRDANSYNHLQDPHPAMPTHRATQYDILHLPDRLRGMSFENTLKTVTHEIDDFMYNQHGQDQSFRDMIKRQICSELATAAYAETTFTQIKDPISHGIKVYGRVVIMTVDQVNKLIQSCR